MLHLLWMRPLLLYADTSVIGGCDDPEFARDSLALWAQFLDGRQQLVISLLTLRELQPAPTVTRRRLDDFPRERLLVLPETAEAASLADTYQRRGILGAGSRADAEHVAHATVARVDAIVSWNFRHIVNLGRIRLFQAANLEEGYGPLDIRSPTEVLDYDD